MSIPSSGGTSSGVTPAPAPVQTISRQTWINQFLALGGWPNTPQNVQAVLTWIMGEGTGAAANPLATTLAAPGATNYNSSGVKNYSSYQSGLQASVDTVKNTPAYAGIDAALSAGNSAPNVLSAIQATHTWTGFGGTFNSLITDLSSTVSNIGGLINQGVPAPGQSNGNDSGAVVQQNYGIPTIGQVIGPAATLLKDLTSGQWWKKVATYGLGAGLVIIGIVIFTGSQKASAAAKAVTE